MLSLGVHSNMPLSRMISAHDRPGLLLPRVGSFDFVPHALHEGDCFINPLQSMRIVTASIRFGGSWWYRQLTSSSEAPFGLITKRTLDDRLVWGTHSGAPIRK